MESLFCWGVVLRCCPFFLILRIHKRAETAQIHKIRCFFSLTLKRQRAAPCALKYLCRPGGVIPAVLSLVFLILWIHRPIKTSSIKFTEVFHFTAKEQSVRFEMLSRIREWVLAFCLVFVIFSRFIHMQWHKHLTEPQNGPALSCYTSRDKRDKRYLETLKLACFRDRVSGVSRFLYTQNS